MRWKKNSMEEISDSEMKAEDFDYILRPSFTASILSSFMPVMVILAPLVIMLVAPDIFEMIGINIPVWKVACGAFTLAFFALVIHEIKRRATRLKLHIDYLVYERGIFLTSVDKLYFQDIKNIKIIKTMGEKALGVGTIAIATAGTGGYEVVITGFSKPEAIMKYISVHRKEGE